MPVTFPAGVVTDPPESSENGAPDWAIRMPLMLHPLRSLPDKLLAELRPFEKGRSHVETALNACLTLNGEGAHSREALYRSR